MKIIDYPNRSVILTGALLIAALLIAFLAGRAIAGGIPGTAALTYAGRLEDASGAPLSGDHNIEVKLWSAATGGADALCATGSQPVAISGGHFSVTLPDDCTAAVKANGDSWAEVFVDGASLGRSKLGAVPYAVEAAHAASADSATSATNAATANGAGGGLAQLLVPSGAVVAFDLDACPTGWRSLGPAAGRVIVGTSSGVARGATVGADQVTLSTNQMPVHSHGIVDPGHRHTPSDALNFLTGGGSGNAQLQSGAGFNFTPYTSMDTTGISLQNAGGNQAFDNRQASLALLFCKKD